VIDALTKVLVGLYEEPERPTNAIDYIRKYMGAPANVDVESMKKENAALRKKVEQLTLQVEALSASSDKKPKDP
jgi:predicted ATP-grasp superfamily ATP-dependent carboligase